MIILDTHVWVWWVHGDAQITETQKKVILDNETNIIGVSAISLWEIAKLVKVKRLSLPITPEEWFEKALKYPGIEVLPITPAVAIKSANLPGDFHEDPADQIIVATARVFDCPLVTSDEKIIHYSHVKTIN